MSNKTSLLMLVLSVWFLFLTQPRLKETENIVIGLLVSILLLPQRLSSFTHYEEEYNMSMLIIC